MAGFGARIVVGLKWNSLENRAFDGVELMSIISIPEQRYTWDGMQLPPSITIVGERCFSESVTDQPKRALAILLRLLPWLSRLLHHVIHSHVLSMPLNRVALLVVWIGLAS